MNIRLGSFASYSEDHFIKIDVTLGQGQKARKNGQINVVFLLGKSVLCCTELGRFKGRNPPNKTCQFYCIDRWLILLGTTSESLKYLLCTGGPIFFKFSGIIPWNQGFLMV